MNLNKETKEFLLAAIRLFYVFKAREEVPGIDRNKQIGFPTRTQEANARNRFIAAGNGIKKTKKETYVKWEFNLDV